MRLCLLVLAAFAATVRADTGVPLLTCPADFTLFRTHFETTCLKLQSKPMLFDDAFKACQNEKSRLLSFAHRMEKVYFINDLIVRSSLHDTQNTTLWFFDTTFMSRHLPRTRGRGKEQKTEPGKAENELPSPKYWMVIAPNEDPAKIQLEANETAVPRNFICEAPAHPAAQRPQFQMEPEHLFIADSMVNPPADAKEVKPFIVTFNCLAYGLPKPTIEWRFIKKAENQSLLSELIDAKVIVNPHEPLKEASITTTAFFNLQHDCKAHQCPPDSIEERSQLVIVNPQFLDLTRSIVCQAKNEFGAVISREAQFFITKLSEFANKSDKLTIKEGTSAVVHNVITAEPDAAAAECFIRKDGNDEHRIPIEYINRRSRGAIQMSKATFDLIIDSARKVDEGEYVCEARMHNGRLGHVVKQKSISVTVEPCSDKECQQTKPLAVVEGYPAMLSMNPMDNRIIRTGDDFLLECPCTGKAKPHDELIVNWNLNNQTDLSVEELKVLPRGSALLLRRATSDKHTGMYYCQCVNGKEKSEWRSINIQVVPSLEPVNRKEILTFKAGQKATFGCRVDAEIADLGVFVEPMRGAETLDDFLAKTSDKRFEVMRGGPSHYTVHIAEAMETDSGIFGCRVTVNFFKKWVSHDTYYTTVIIEK